MPAVPFNATIWPANVKPLASNAEIVRVTAMSGDDVTAMTRAQEGTSAIAIAVGYQFSATITAKTLTDAELTISDGTNTQGSGTIRLSNANGVSFGLNAGTLTASVAAGGGAFSAGVSNVGNTAGATGVSGTRLVLVGSQNITLSQTTDANGLTVSFSGGAGAAGNTGFISAGAATASLGTVVFSNSNGVSFGVNGQTVTASHNGLTQQSTQPVAVSAANGSYAFSTLSFSNANGISFGTSAGSALTASHNGLTTARASNDAVGLNTALTAGPLAWTVNSAGISLNAGSAAGTTSGFTGNLISGSMTHNTAGLALSLNHPAWLTTAMQSNAVTLSNIRVSGGTTSNLLSALTFNDANGISFGLNASTLTASHNGLTTARASTDAIGLNTAQSNVTWTVNSSGLSLDARGYAGTGTTFAGANISVSLTQNSAGLNMSASVAAGGGGGVTPVASASNGSFSFTTLAFSNANNVTFGTSAGSIITASVAAPGAAAEANAINLLGANTAGNTTATGSTIGWSGVNLTLSGTNASQVVVSAPATSSLSATGILSISTNGSTISIGAAAGTATMWQPFNEGVNVLGQQGQATMQIVPLPTPTPAALGELHVDRLVVPLYWSNSSNSTGTVTLSLSFGLYTKTASTLSLAMSTSYSTAWTFSGTASSATYNGIRLHTIPWTTTIDDGRYYVAQWIRTTTGGGNGTLSQVLISQLNTNFSGVFGVASNRSHQWPAGYGVYSASITTAMPSSVVFSQIDGTASLAARPPSFFMINGTV